jgi:hypothetical protein
MSFLRAASRGTLLSMARELARPEATQFVDGACEREPPFAHQKRFTVRDPSGARREVTAVSVPGPESLLLPSHTAARTVRTYVAAPGLSLGSLFATHASSVVPRVASTLGAVLRHVGRRGRHDLPEAGFEVIVEAAKGGVSALARARGTGPYRITAEIQAHAISLAALGRVTVKGAVAPSVAFDSEWALAMLERNGVTLELTDRSRER